VTSGSLKELSDTSVVVFGRILRLKPYHTVSVCPDVHVLSRALDQLDLGSVMKSRIGWAEHVTLMGEMEMLN
jgi:hypothetical protein